MPAQNGLARPKKPSGVWHPLIVHTGSKIFNTTDLQSLTVEAGDILHVEMIVHGSLIVNALEKKHWLLFNTAA